MKKILALILAALMMMTVLVACGEKTENNDDVNNDDANVSDTGDAADTSDDTAEDTADDTTEDVADDTAESNSSVTLESSLSEIIVKLNETKTPEFMTGEIPVDLADPDTVKYMTGLDSADKIKEAAAHESMMGSQAYSLVLVRLNDAADAEAVAAEMKNGIDQRKWICVEADDLRVVAAGDLVMLIMIDSEYASVITAADYVDAFTALAGGSLSVDLK